MYIQFAESCVKVRWF